MTRKDYELIARTIKDQTAMSAYSSELRALTSRLSSAFMADNPRFDPDKFTKACGF